MNWIEFVKRLSGLRNSMIIEIKVALQRCVAGFVNKSRKLSSHLSRGAENMLGSYAGVIQ